jgi:hypothetical protein
MIWPVESSFEEEKILTPVANGDKVEIYIFFIGTCVSRDY